MSSISFSGVGSGLPVDSWITALVSAETTKYNHYYTEQEENELAQSTLNTLQSQFSLLKSAIQDLTDGNITKALDVFSNKTVTSSDDDIATATAGTNAATQNVELSVSQLATCTTAESVSQIGQYADEDTLVQDLMDGSGEEGIFTIYVNNEAYQFEIEEDVTTIGDVIDDINNTFTGGEVVASITDGKFKLDVDNESGAVTDFKFGATNDESNFLTLTQLKSVDADAGLDSGSDNVDYAESTITLSGVSSTSKLVGNDANLNTEVTAGTFTIGDVEFEVTSGTTMSDLVGNINSDEDTGVYATYDVKNNKLVLTSRDTGAVTISMEDGTSNFLEAMGLVESDGSLADGSQELGDNCIATINGNAVESTSNKLTSDVTGLAGLTLNVSDITWDNDDNKDDPITISIKQDTDEAVESVEYLVERLNTVIGAIDAGTDYSDGALSGEYTLLSIMNSLRTTATSGVSGLDSDYISMIDIGISTGDAGASTSDDTTTLQFDSGKFLDALADDPEAVRAILIGDEDAGITGIVELLENIADSATDIDYGYFAARSNSLEEESVRLSDSIEDAERHLEDYEKRITSEFTAMDTEIAALSAQLNYL